eukprot:gb/GEZN01005712.1/.p1 GENE.gb/GEZN01005712.1/~~gb/GEZN01005712.1/.p1  ORF type:complete len:512 (-),score=99.58 gb/GEZN01005712.1/:126-1661(-)
MQLAIASRFSVVLDPRAPLCQIGRRLSSLPTPTGEVFPSPASTDLKSQRSGHSYRPRNATPPSRTLREPTPFSLSLFSLPPQTAASLGLLDGLNPAQSLGVASLLAGFFFLSGRYYERMAHRQQTEQTGRNQQGDATQQAQELRNSFAAISAEALRQSQEQFLTLAEENFKRVLAQGQWDLKQQEKGLGQLVEPLQETLDKSRHQVQELERNRLVAFGKLESQLQTMAQEQTQLRQETGKLVNALRRPEVRGRWGEITLQRLAELSGMAEHCDFFLQPRGDHRNQDMAGAADEKGSKLHLMRPDMVVRLPNEREIVVDAKTPLDAYLNATDAADATERETELVRHAGQVRRQVRTLSSKAYWTQFSRSPDFVVLFLPGEPFLSAALEKDPSLLEDALADKVILATPNSLIALLWVISAGWRQEKLARNVQEIQVIGQELHQRIATLLERVGKLGKSLTSSVESYNATVTTLEKKFLPKVRQLEELGVRGKKTIPELEPVQVSPTDTAVPKE